MKNSPLLISSIALFSAFPTQAQRNDVPQEDRYLPVEVQVTLNGDQAVLYRVALFKDNLEVTTLEPSRRGAFLLALDLEAYYTIRISKEGYQEKLIHVDTHLPAGAVVNEAYPCLVNLEPLDRFAYSDPFYLDFPCAIVRWNAERQTFDHSDPYLADIQLKMVLLGVQAAAK